MRVLVTGSQGYIGCLLAPYLVERGHEVAGVDAGFYRENSLYDGTPLTVETLTRDIRQLAEADFEGVRRGRSPRGALQRPSRPAPADDHA